MKRKTTKHHRHPRQSVLQVRVMSPRIAWFGFLNFSGKLFKLTCVLAVLTGIGWGVWRGIQHAFYKNPDFRLQVIDLNANPVIDELGVAQVTGINLATNPNLFDVDVNEAARKLSELPAITEAIVERHLPGTLVVRIVPRTPKAWISSPGEDNSQVRHVGGMLVDTLSVAYPCPEMQAVFAANLPIIELPAFKDHPIQAGTKIQNLDLQHCLALLDSAREADSEAPHWIESISPVNDWSLLLVTRQGTSATFGLGDHARQIDSLRAALDHAGQKGYIIDTINLIPKYNIPITVRRGNAPPKAIPVAESAPVDPDQARRARDLGNLLNRN